MKKLVFLFTAFFILCFSLFLYTQQKQTVSHQSLGQQRAQITNTPYNTPRPPNIADIQYSSQGIQYGISRIIIKDPLHVSLLVNKDKMTTREFKQLYDCVAITSGGFYNMDYSPLGLVISNGTIVQPFQKNLLLNGVFSVKDGVPSITNEPIDGATLALQSGPRLYRNGAPLSLSIINDEPARRIVAITTPDNEILLLAFYQLDNLFLGPLLGDLPHHVSLFQSSTKTSIIDALNLDGGSASSFDNAQTSLDELTTVGSFFCLR
jgi:exopolysaccharide biosynthesis protein